MGAACRVLEVPHGSDMYFGAVALRRRVLRIPLGLDYSESELAAESDSRHLVAVDSGNRVVGCLVLRLPGEADGAARMRQVAVEPGLQGRGIGRSLVVASEAVASGAGSGEMVLHAREVARPFYERLGYKVEGEVFFEVGLRHWKMRKWMGER